MKIQTTILNSASLSNLFNGSTVTLVQSSSLGTSINVSNVVFKLQYGSSVYNVSSDSCFNFSQLILGYSSSLFIINGPNINRSTNFIMNIPGNIEIPASSSLILQYFGSVPTTGNGTLQIDIYYDTYDVTNIDPKFVFESGVVITSSISIGNGNDARSFGSLALGLGSTTNGSYSVAEGSGSFTDGLYSHAQGVGTYARASGSHSEGQNTTAYGNYSHAEGQTSVASGSHSHAEGSNTNATGRWSHTEGKATLTIGDYSHAEGDSTVAYGDYSHTSGQGTIASGSAQTVVGQYNKRGNTTDLFVVGGGTGDADANRKDIFNVSTTTIAMSGSVNISGSILFTPPTSPNFNGEIVRFGSGTLTTGQLYFLSSSGTWSLANANSTGSSTGMLGIAVGSSPSTNGLLIRGYAASSSYTYGTGSIVYMATGSGIMTATSPSSSNHVVRVLGYQTTLSNTIYFDPDKTWVTLA